MEGGIPRSSGTHEYGSIVFDDYHEGEDSQKVVTNVDGDVEVDSQGKYSDFSFQTFLWPNCPFGTHRQCCPVDCRFLCGCEESEKIEKLCRIKIPEEGHYLFVNMI